MSSPAHEVVIERHLGEGPPTREGDAIANALGALPGRPIQWAWRCSCGAGGTGSCEAVTLEGRQHQYLNVPVMHLLSQEGQPYGSERRCCNHCGVMIWGSSAPPHVDNRTDWRAHPNNCGTRS